jgi:hypothetical protein
MTKVINESNKVFVMSMRKNRCNPPDIIMNNIKTFRGTHDEEKENFTFAKFA